MLTSFLRRLKLDTIEFVSLGFILVLLLAGIKLSLALSMEAHHLTLREVLWDPKILSIIFFVVLAVVSVVVAAFSFRRELILREKMSTCSHKHPHIKMRAVIAALSHLQRERPHTDLDIFSAADIIARITSGRSGFGSDEEHVLYVYYDLETHVR